MGNARYINVAIAHAHVLTRGKREDELSGAVDRSLFHQSQTANSVSQAIITSCTFRAIIIIIKVYT